MIAPVLLVSLAAASQAAPQRLVPFASISGSQSLYQRPALVKATTPAAWQGVLARHYGTNVNGPDDRESSDTVTLNFGTCMALVVFGGSLKNVQGLVYDSTEEGPQQVAIKIRREFSPDPNTTLLTNPYLFLLMPRSTKKLVVDLDMRTSADENPRWVRQTPAAALPAD